MWRWQGVDVALLVFSIQCSLPHCQINNKTNKKKDLPLFNTHTEHTHHPCFWCMGWWSGCCGTKQGQCVNMRRGREWVPQNRRPVMFLVRKRPQINVYGYNYLFEFSKEMVKYAPAMHMIHGSKAFKGPEGSPLSAFPLLHPCKNSLNITEPPHTHPSLISLQVNWSGSEERLNWLDWTLLWHNLCAMYN